MISNGTLTRMRDCAAATALGLVLAAGAITTAQADPPRQAKPRSAQSQAHTPRLPGDYTRHTEVQRTDHGHARTDTWTGENGRTATRHAEVVNDRANQTRTRDVEWTGPNGQQAARTDVTQRTDNGYTRNSTATGTWTKDVSVGRAPPSDGA